MPIEALSDTFAIRSHTLVEILIAPSHGQNFIYKMFAVFFECKGTIVAPFTPNVNRTMHLCHALSFNIPSNLYYKTRTKSQKFTVSRLVLQLSPRNLLIEDVVGAAPTGDAQTTSE